MIACSIRQFEGTNLTNRPEGGDFLRTMKHRLAWTVAASEVKTLSATRKRKRSGNPPGEKRRQQPVAPLNDNELQCIFQRGTLHVITSGGPAQNAQRFSIKPELKAAGEYVAVLLAWVGNRWFQHHAMNIAACLLQTRGLGVLLFLLVIHTRWEGTQTGLENVLRGKLDPESDHMKSMLSRRKLSLSSDQLECLRQMNNTDAHCMAFRRMQVPARLW